MQTAPKSSAVRADVQSLVLLPLVDESEQRDGEWFAEMLTNDLTAELSRMPGALAIWHTPRELQGKGCRSAMLPRNLACAT